MIQWRLYFRQIACDRSLRGDELRVLFLMLSFIDEGVLIQITPKDIAERLGKRPDSVSRAIHRLVERGVIEKRYEEGKLVGYEIVENYQSN